MYIKAYVKYPEGETTDRFGCTLKVTIAPEEGPMSDFEYIVKTYSRERDAIRGLKRLAKRLGADDITLYKIGGYVVYSGSDGTLIFKQEGC